MPFALIAPPPSIAWTAADDAALYTLQRELGARAAEMALELANVQYVLDSITVEIERRRQP